MTITLAFSDTKVALDRTMGQIEGILEKKVKGSTAEMAARALYWHLDVKFKAIEWGLEEFDVAFMPHLVTQIGRTMAEDPLLVLQVLQEPEDIGRLALPAPPEARP